MTDRHDYVMTGAYASDDAMSVADDLAADEPADAERLPAVYDMAPPPTANPGKIITQYARLQEDQPPRPIVHMIPDIRKQHALNDFRYLKGNSIKSFMNHRVTKMAAIKTSQEAKVLEKRIGDHIMALRNAGFDRLEAANEGVKKVDTALKKMERKFYTDEVITLRNDNFELTRENRKRETDWKVLWAYNGELREKYAKVRSRALLAERELFDIQDRAAAAQLQAELKRAASEGHELWLDHRRVRLRSRFMARDE